MGLPKDISYQAQAKKLVEEAGVDSMTLDLIKDNLETAMAGGMSPEAAKAALQAAIEAQAPGRSDTNASRARTN